MGWQPIETAPKDGTEVLVYGQWAGEIGGKGDFGMFAATYGGPGREYPAHEWDVVGVDGYSAWVRATHWMPLPAPPKSA